MTILEGYFAKIDEYPEDELKLCVASRYPFFVKKQDGPPPISRPSARGV